MKALVVIAILALSAGGCVQISPEEEKAHAAPIGALPEIIKAATGFRLAQARWPETKEELADGFQYWKEEPEFLSEIQAVSIVEQSSSSILYRCIFYGGGSTEVRVNLKVKEPNQALEGTRLLVTSRAPARLVTSSRVPIG